MIRFMLSCNRGISDKHPRGIRLITGSRFLMVTDSPGQLGIIGAYQWGISSWHKQRSRVAQTVHGVRPRRSLKIARSTAWIAEKVSSGQVANSSFFRTRV